MKKMLALLLAAVMVLSMAACAAAPATTPAERNAPGCHDRSRKRHPDDRNH